MESEISREVPVLKGVGYSQPTELQWARRAIERCLRRRSTAFVRLKGMNCDRLFHAYAVSVSGESEFARTIEFLNRRTGLNSN
jgi:hypothetical protein